ncbi:hypothetical protein A1O7_06791 [Cladophialophora yegresii CBS 114405]|uniref:Uncharacterized protein n=1 Tax=Cladophialophora yegresii CBS 114405 TaxID=1182544 RepID=W9VL89_9EURO|nr:uncharacterized protein A1O7_06791 [Cladophialophora yegresii CBS 114405]EXJ56447.1 hypothetical protein A1O7_06791 [Cladophialophora yegresii CBS 114405]
MPARESVMIEVIPCDRASTEEPSIEVAFNATPTGHASSKAQSPESTTLYGTSISKEPSMNEHNIFDVSSHADGAAGKHAAKLESMSPPKKLATGVVSTEQQISKLAHVFPWLRSDAEEEATSEPAVVAPVEDELASSFSDDSHSLTHVFVWLRPSYTSSQGETDVLEPVTDPDYDVFVTDKPSDDPGQAITPSGNLSLLEEQPAFDNAAHDLTVDRACAPYSIAHISESSVAHLNELPFINRPVIQEPSNETLPVEQPNFATSTTPPPSHDCARPQSAEEPDPITTASKDVAVYESPYGTLDHVFVFQKSVLTTVHTGSRGISVYESPFMTLDHIFVFRNSLATNSSASAEYDRHVGEIVTVNDSEAPGDVHVTIQEQAVNATREDDPTPNDGAWDKNELDYMAADAVVVDQDPGKNSLTEEDAVQPECNHHKTEHSTKPELDTDTTSSLAPSTPSYAETVVTGKAVSPSPHPFHDVPPVLTPWSFTPIIVGATASAILVSALSPALSATMLWASVIYTKNKLRC